MHLTPTLQEGAKDEQYLLLTFITDSHDDAYDAKVLQTGVLAKLRALNIPGHFYSDSVAEHIQINASNASDALRSKKLRSLITSFTIPFDSDVIDNVLQQIEQLLQLSPSSTATILKATTVNAIHSTPGIPPMSPTSSSASSHPTLSSHSSVTTASKSSLSNTSSSISMPFSSPPLLVVSHSRQSANLGTSAVLDETKDDLDDSPLFNEYFVEVVADRLDKAATRNSEIPLPERSLVFTSGVPPIDFASYLKRIQNYLFDTTACPVEKLWIHALVYIDRCEKTLLLTKKTRYRLILVAALTATKILYDEPRDNTHAAKVGGIPRDELNQLERCFLRAINHKGWVGPLDYKLYTKEILAHKEYAHARLCAQSPPNETMCLAAPPKIDEISLRTPSFTSK